MGLAGAFDGAVSSAAFLAYVAALWFYQWKASLLMIVGGFAAAAILSASLGYCILFLREASDGGVSSNTGYGDLIYQGIPMMAAAVIGQLGDQAPLWLLAQIGTAKDVAVYGVGLQLIKQ